MNGRFGHHPSQSASFEGRPGGRPSAPAAADGSSPTSCCSRCGTSLTLAIRLPGSGAPPFGDTSDRKLDLDPHLRHSFFSRQTKEKSKAFPAFFHTRTMRQPVSAISRQAELHRPPHAEGACKVGRGWKTFPPSQGSSAPCSRRFPAFLHTPGFPGITLRGFGPRQVHIRQHR